MSIVKDTHAQKHTDTEMAGVRKVAQDKEYCYLLVVDRGFQCKASTATMVHVM